MKYAVKIQTNAKKNEIVEEKDDFLKIRIKAIPEKGRANDALIKFLSKHFKIPKSNIKIIKGETIRNKTVEVEK